MSHTLIALVLNTFRTKPRHLLTKNIITNIFRTQAYDLIIQGYFYNGFIDFIFEVKSLTDFTNLFMSHDFGKNGKVILNYF